MLLFLFLFGLALGAVSPSDEPHVELQRASCPMLWYSFNGRCYKYVATGMTWADAELHCVSEGANLVSIHSRAEEDFVRSLVKNFDRHEKYTWIGLSDIHKEGRWMWSDGSAVNYVFWNSGEPNNDRGKEHCTHTNFNTQWNDVRCSEIYPCLCISRNLSLAAEIDIPV
ncbi:lactose-binding lectin l-2-like [Cottoperca gobio]|uniref:Lactose-binding lectin l-2-like n=1 Tax=Cottoperca gobio TaxID=56716 RepID=A0A6J2QPS6_COTGO|nr:lactose-binding lectin l-2-like [Cottoperca gobio]